MTTTTLNAIRDKEPCHSGWTKLLKYLGKTKADNDPLSLLTIIDSNGLDDALWVLQETGCDEMLSRHFCAWCAEQVPHVSKADAREAALEAARAIALDAAGKAAEEYKDESAEESEEESPWKYDWESALESAWDAAWDEAWNSARAAQEQQLRKMLAMKEMQE